MSFRTVKCGNTAANASASASSGFAPAERRVRHLNPIEGLQAYFAERKALERLFHERLATFCSWYGNKNDNIILAKREHFLKLAEPDIVGIALENLALKHRALNWNRFIPKAMRELDAEITRLVALKDSPSLRELPYLLSLEALRHGEEHGLKCLARYTRLQAQGFDEEIARLAAVSDDPRLAASLKQAAEKLDGSSPRMFALLELVKGPMLDFSRGQTGA